MTVYVNHHDWSSSKFAVLPAVTTPGSLSESQIKILFNQDLIIFKDNLRDKLDLLAQMYYLIANKS